MVLLVAARFVRLIAYGLQALTLVFFLKSLGFNEDKVGWFMTLTLIGDVVLSYLLAVSADRIIGRKNILVLGSTLMMFTGVAFFLTDNYIVLLLAAIVGVVSPGGQDLGPFKAVEESALAHLTTIENRANVYAWYTAFGDFGVAIGTVVTGHLVQYWQTYMDDVQAYRRIYILFTALAAVKVVLALGLGKDVELDHEPLFIESGDAEASIPSETQPILGTSSGGNVSGQSSAKVYGSQNTIETGSSQSLSKSPTTVVQNDDEEDEESNVGYYTRRQQQSPQKSPSPQDQMSHRLHMTLLPLLFALDAFASSLATTSWTSYYLSRKFGLLLGALGSLFFATGLISTGVSFIGAYLSSRLGPVVTMVITHLPSSLLLCFIPVPSTAGPTLAIIILRSCTSRMDVAPRQAFLSAVVHPSERTRVMALVNMLKTTASSVAPLLVGYCATRNIQGICFVLAGVLKVTYDLCIAGGYINARLTH